jgi:hypothetical protein
MIPSRSPTESFLARHGASRSLPIAAINTGLAVRSGGSRSVSVVNVVVAATTPDIEAETIAAAVAERTDMTLVAGRVLAVSETDVRIGSTALPAPYAVVLVGPEADTAEPAERYLADRPDAVVMRVNVPFGDVVRIALHGVGLEQLLAELPALVEAGATARPRTVQFRSAGALMD